MKKFLTLLFAFTCLAFSEMRGQSFFCSTEFGGNIEQLMNSTDGANFTIFISFGNNGRNYFGGFRYSNGNIYKYVNNFPNGVAGDINMGSPIPYVIPGGNYLIRFNVVTQEFSFIGGSYQTFDDCGIWASSCNKLSVYPSSDFSSFQWKRNGVAIPGATNSEYVHPSNLPEGEYVYTCDAFSTDSAAVISSNSISLSNPIPLTAVVQNANDFCSNRQFKATINQPGSDWTFQWRKDGQAISGATQSTYNAAPQQQASTYTCLASCPNNNASKESNTVSVPGCFGDSSSAINYLLVQNMTTTGNNAANKTIQVQFDLSWGNTWWDDINWDAAWVFMKYKTAAGEWKHAKINPAGFDKGQGSPSIIQPTADKMGAFVRLGQKGQGNFNAEGMQLQWNYGLDGLNSVNGLEVKVFATEMVYQPQGDFTVSRGFRVMNSYDNFGNPDSTIDYFLSASGNNVAIINSRLTPKLTAPGISGIRIKGDAGLDLDYNGTIDNITYPTGYYPFYLFKYEMSEQAYADFLNCLSPAQVSNLGIAGTSISLNQGQYFAASPNRACKGANAQRLLAYSDWTGLRPATFLELQKAYNGPNASNLPFFDWNPNIGGYNNQPKFSIHFSLADPNQGQNSGIPYDASGKQGRGFYGAKDLIGNVWEPYVKINYLSFQFQNGDGILGESGFNNYPAWNFSEINWGNFLPSTNNCALYYKEDGNQIYNFQCYGEWGFRLCRSAE
jgi:hypothetical protein